ncbi:hypothetical protein LTR70_009743 [Exophiala xenobiotica]|uniref:Uncharacterized protein n=1 Tax=Lithohypha guttulata TaxID=1690604 RepID=A0ABR0JYB4_9EURO|nr:hypothetical protein LTR24_009623 [Lithohypha guttulata]KAK5310090.1 hypothetical protein LTR70_009743 [Exophiala xenobiotica]
MSRIYRIADINIPSLKVYSSQLDTICVLEDGITFIMPDEESGKATIKVYEVPIVDEVVVRTGTSGKFSLTVAWGQEKGHMFLKARRFPVTAIYLQFLEDQDRRDFVEAFKGRTEDLGEATKSQTASLRQTAEQPPQRKCSIALIDLPSEAEGTTDEDELGARSVPRGARGVQGPHLHKQRLPEEIPQPVPEPSSDLVFGQPGPSSDVFGPGDYDVSGQAEYEEGIEENEEGHQSRNSSSDEDGGDGRPEGVLLKDRLLASKTQDAHNILTGRTPSSDDSGQPMRVSPSPPERTGKRQADGPLRVREGAMAHRTSLRAQDPALTQALAASNDQDFTSFRNTNNKVDAATQQKGHGLPAKRQEPSLSQEPTANRASRPCTSINSYATGQSQGQLSKAADAIIAMPRPRKVENVQSQHTTASPTAKKSTTKLRPVKKLNSQIAADISVSSAERGQGAQARGNGIIESGAGEMKGTVGAQQEESDPKADESIYDLDADSAEADNGRLRAKKKRTAGDPVSKKLLKDTTNVSRPAGSLIEAAKKTNKAKKGKTKQPRRSLKPEAQAPTRRSQRAVAKQATTYEEPSESEIDEEESIQEQLVDSDTPDEDDDAGNSGKRRWVTRLKQKKATGNEIAMASEQVQAKAFTEQTGRTPGGADGAGGSVTGYGNNAKRKGASASKGVTVPSSDPPIEPKDGQLAQSTQQPSGAITAGHETAAQTQSVEQNVAEDSYPKEARARRTDGAADASFASKLNKFAMIAQLPQARDIQQDRAPFGDAKKFIQNVNGARSSASPVKEQLVTNMDRSRAKSSKATRQIEYDEPQLSGDVSVAEASPAARTPADEDNEPLVTVQDKHLLADDAAHDSDVQDVSAALSSVERSHVAVSEQVSDVVDEIKTCYDDRQNNDEGEEVAQQAPGVGHRPEAKTDSSKNQQRSTATSLEIADSQDKDAIDYSMIGDKVAGTGTAPPGAAPRSAVPQPEQMAAHDVDPLRYVEVHRGNQQKVDAPSAEAQAGLSSAADATLAAQVAQPVRHTQPQRATVQTPAGHLSEAKRPSSNNVSRAPRKSSLIHFGSAGPQNQGSPIKVGAEPTTTQEARWSLVTTSLKRSARRSDVASEALPSGPTSIVMAEGDDIDETIIDGGDLEVTQGLSLRTSVEPAAQRTKDRPGPRTSDKVDVDAQRPVNNGREQNEFTKPQAAALIEVGDQGAHDSALVSRKNYAPTIEPNGRHRVNEAAKDTRRISAPFPLSTTEDNMAQAHESPAHIAVDNMKLSNQISLTPAEAASTGVPATRAQTELAISLGHREEVRSSAVSTANKEGSPDRVSTLTRGEQSGSPTKEHSSFAGQASPRKANQVPTKTASHGKDANNQTAGRPAQAAVTVTRRDDHEASALESRNIKTFSGSGTRAPVPAPRRALASVDHVATQGRNQHDVNDQHKSTVAEAVPSPAVRTQFKLPPSRSALVHEQGRAQAGNSQDSPVNISSTELISEQDSPSQSEQESEFEASAADESLLPSESRRPTRRTAARSELHRSSPSESDEEPVQEQPPPPAKRRKITKAQQMAQTMVQRPQEPDDISHFVQRQFPDARSMFSFIKTMQAGPPSTLPFNLDLTNVFGAKDVANPTEAPSIQTPSKLHRAHLDPDVPNPLNPASFHAKSARNIPSPKMAHMPPPARPISKVDQESVHPGNPRLARTSNKTASYREGPANAHFSNDDSKRTSNIKRIRQVLGSPAKISQNAAPTCTPQPFHERLHAATSPTSDIEPFSAPELHRTSHDHSDAGETTLVEPYFLLRNTVPRSPSVVSTNRDSEFPATPQPEDREANLNNASLGHVLGVRASNGIQQSLQQAILAMTQDICVRLEHEDEAARGLVQRYHDGCAEMLEELKHNVGSRLRHDAGKLVKSTEELQTRIKNTAEMLSQPPEKNDQTAVPLPSVSGEDATNRGQDLLEMLDGVSC